MGNSIFGIAISGLHTAQSGLMTTAHNIANVNTPGYSRQETVQATTLPAFYGSGYFGSGVTVENVRRQYDQYLEGQVRETRSQASGTSVLAGQLAAVDNLLADVSSGLSPALDGFFSGMDGVAARPADAAARQTLLSSADAFAARVRDLDARLSAMRNGVNQQVETAAATVNAYAERIAELNKRIRESTGGGAQVHAPNDLLDQRDQLLRELSSEVGIAVVADTDGSANVFIGGRQPLVIGAQAYRLEVFADPESPRDKVVGSSGTGVSVPLRAADLGGGRLGGLVEFRDTDLAQARASLGRIAMAVAEDVNLQHQLGQDRSGNAGGAFFGIGSPSATSRTNNAGSASLSIAISDLSAVRTSAYRLDYDGSNWNLTRRSDGTVQTFASLPQTVDGFTVSIASGSAAAGDSFLLEPTANAATSFATLIRDPSRVAAAAPITTGAASTNTGDARISQGTVNASLPLNANLRQPVTLTFTSAGTFDVTGTGTGNPTGVAYVDGATVTYNGWSVTLSGTPVAGDRFTISPNTGGTADGRNMLALAALQSARSLESGSASYGEAYAMMVSDVGNRARTAEVTLAAQDALAAQTEDRQQSVSGVNLDEEAANLLRYQQAYQAAGKALAVAGTLFDALLEITR